jgi:hypothetical protein
MSPFYNDYLTHENVCVILTQFCWTLCKLLCDRLQKTLDSTTRGLRDTPIRYKLKPILRLFILKTVLFVKNTPLYVFSYRMYQLPRNGR